MLSGLEYLTKKTWHPASNLSIIDFDRNILSGGHRGGRGGKAGSMRPAKRAAPCRNRSRSRDKDSGVPQ